MGHKNRIIAFYRKNKKVILLTVRLVVSISLIAFLIITRFSDIQSIAVILKSVNKNLILLALLASLFNIWITAVRWKTLLNTQKVRLGTGTLTVSVSIGFFFNNFLPTTIGGDVFRTYDAAKKGNIPLGTSASIILVERFSGVVSAATYAIIALFLGFTVIGNKPVIIPIIIFFAIAAILAFLIINPSILRLEKLFNRFNFLGKLRARLSSAYGTLKSFKRFKIALIKVLLYSFLLQFTFILSYFLAARSLGIELSLASFVFIVPVVAAIAMIPISIGGIGLRENSLVFIMVAMGVTNEKAAICSLIIFIMLILIGLAGGIIYVIRPYFENRFKTNNKSSKY